MSAGNEHGSRRLRAAHPRFVGTPIYESRPRNYLIPHLGPIRLDKLRASQVAGMFAEIAEQAKTAQADNAARRQVEDAAKAAWRRGDKAAWRQARDRLAGMPPYRRLCGASTRQRIRATLRSALTVARREQLIVVNVAGLVEMAPAKPAKARVRTDERVARWRATGEVPSSVMVWANWASAMIGRIFVRPYG